MTEPRPRANPSTSEIDDGRRGDVRGVQRDQRAGKWRTGVDRRVRARLGKVEQWPGFDHLEVWHDERDPTHVVMVSWWADKSDFSAYMLSDIHRRSHDRIDKGSDAPKPAHFSRYRVVAR